MRGVPRCHIFVFILDLALIFFLFMRHTVALGLGALQTINASILLTSKFS